MFPVKNRIGEDIKNLRKELKLSKTKLSQLSKVSVKTIYNLEKKNRIGKIETFFKIKEALRKNFKFDLFQKTGANVIWKFEDLDQEILNIVEGGLLGDGCIAKYGVYKQEAKDKKY